MANSNDPKAVMGSFGYSQNPANFIPPSRPNGGSYPQLPMYQPKTVNIPDVAKKNSKVL